MKKILHLIKRYLTYFWMFICKIYFKLTKRKNEEIKRMKDSYVGKRVFIVATGPSLSEEDLNMIRNEYTITMNSMIKHMKKYDFKPDFYIIQDASVFRNIYTEINDSKLKNIFIGRGNSYNMRVNIGKKDLKCLNIQYFTFNLDSNYHYYDMLYRPNKRNIKFSYDFSDYVSDGYTVAYSAIQLAYYLGFSEIYLLGCDCTFSGHFGENSDKNNDVKPKYFEAYECCKKAFADKNITIKNCTRGGMLEVFERETLENVLRSDKYEKNN